MTAEQTLEARVRRLEDREEIWRLITSFRLYVDSGDFAAFASLFGDEGELVTNLGPPATGPAEIEALLEKTLERTDETKRMVHYVTNPMIDVDGDRATAECTWCFVSRDAEDKPVVTFAGHYSDVFTRQRGEWKFLRRTVYLDMPHTPFGQPVPAGGGTATAS